MKTSNDQISSLGMVILLCPFPLSLARVFPTPQKEQDFSPVPRDEAGMSLDFLDLSHPASHRPPPTPPRVAKSYNCKFFIP